MIDQTTTNKEHYHISNMIHVSTHNTTHDFTITNIASFTNMKSLNTTTIAMFNLNATKTLFAKHNYNHILITNNPINHSLAGTINPHTKIRNATNNNHFTFDSLKSFISIIHTILLAFANVTMLINNFTIFNSLSITITQHTHKLKLLQMIGTTHQQVHHNVLLKTLTINTLTNTTNININITLATNLNALFETIKLDLPQIGLILSTRTMITSLLVNTLTTLTTT